MEKKRFSNFELLRVLLILFVIILHYNDSSRHGAFSFIESASFANKMFLYGIESFTICAVNAFVCLSGYFLSGKKEVNVRKIYHLFLILFSYNVFRYVLSSVIHHDFSVKGFIYCFIPNNYYANLYSVLFLLSPFLNLVIKKLNNKNYEKFLLILISLFSIIPTITDYLLVTIFDFKFTSVSPISLYGNGRGFTLVNFVLLYYVGGYIARKDYTKKLKPLFIYILSSFFIFITLTINRTAAFSYCNILVVIQAASLITFFKNIHFQSNVINSLAKSVWGIFCIHGFIMAIYCKIFPYNLNVSMASLSMHFFACIIFVFICSIIWEKICAFILKPLELLLDKIKLFNKSITVKDEN